MGTVFSIDIRDPGDWSAAVAEVVGRLHHVDAVLSPYRPGSDLCRLQRRELRLRDADPMVAVVLDLCAEVEAETGGAFSARYGGTIDPTGLVKGWAVEAASRLLRDRGSANHAVGGGGDLQLAGRPEPDRPWTVGVTDPADRRRVLTTVTGSDLAVATSGTAERGAHVLDPATGRPVTHLAGATVIGPSLTRADAYATAALVLGPGPAPWLAAHPPYAALLVTPGGTLHPSPGWPAHGSDRSARTRSSTSTSISPAPSARVITTTAASSSRIAFR